MALQKMRGIEAPSTVVPDGTGHLLLSGALYSKGWVRTMSRPLSVQRATTEPLNSPLPAAIAAFGERSASEDEATLLRMLRLLTCKASSLILDAAVVVRAPEKLGPGDRR